MSEEWLYIRIEVKNAETAKQNATNCDVIHYLQKGRVIASGSYNELLAKAGHG